MLETSLEELESIQIENEVKNLLVTITNLVINSGDAKAMLRHLWKAIELHDQQYNKYNWDQPVKIVQWNCRSLRKNKMYIRISYGGPDGYCLGHFVFTLFF
jgi:hypothetical protein